MIIEVYWLIQVNFKNYAELCCINLQCKYINLLRILAWHDFQEEE